MINKSITLLENLERFEFYVSCDDEELKELLSFLKKAVYFCECELSTR